VAEFRSFANGLTDDLQAVRAALKHEWGNGQVERQVHRLKLVKRLMYGRGKLNLLRARMLQVA
jgi:transposase